MLWLFDETLKEHLRVSEGGFCFTPCAGKPLYELLLVARDAHSPSAATGSGLDDYRISGLSGEFDGLFIFNNRVFRPGDDRHGSCHGDSARCNLVTHLALHLRCRTDKDDARFFALFGELGIFRKKSIAGMNGVRAFVLCQVD